MFDANKAKNHIIKWIRQWFKENGGDCDAVVGISGGKDSTIVAALLVEALGKERVIGVMMPMDCNNPIKESREICKYLGIKHYTIDVGVPTEIIRNRVVSQLGIVSRQAEINLPARLRMAVLYAVAQSRTAGARVANTCNLSEDYVGYSTRYGDSAGDFSPLANFTVTEVRAIGKALGLPDEFVYKVPSDGLCGKTDEDNLGFTYDVLDKYIRTGVCENAETKAKIDALHRKNAFKFKPMPSCPNPFAAVQKKEMYIIVDEGDFENWTELSGIYTDKDTARAALCDSYEQIKQERSPEGIIEDLKYDDSFEIIFDDKLCFNFRIEEVEFADINKDTGGSE